MTHQPKLSSVTLRTSLLCAPQLSLWKLWQILVLGKEKMLFNLLLPKNILYLFSKCNWISPSKGRITNEWVLFVFSPGYFLVTIFCVAAWRVANLAVEQSSRWYGQCALISHLSSTELNSKTIASGLHRQNLAACTWVITWLAEYRFTVQYWWVRKGGRKHERRKTAHYQSKSIPV